MNSIEKARENSIVKKDVRRILKNELIQPNSRSGILHASAFSAIVLYYLKIESELGDKEIRRCRR